MEKQNPTKASSSPIDEYISKDQFCEDLDIHPRTEDRWHSLRIGPPRTKVGKQILFKKSSVAAWLAQREEAAIR